LNFFKRLIYLFEREREIEHELERGVGERAKGERISSRLPAEHGA